MYKIFFGYVMNTMCTVKFTISLPKYDSVLEEPCDCHMVFFINETFLFTTEVLHYSEGHDKIHGHL